ncbi:PREDICTED: uncharacterized protein LOC104783417 [Camelina sativa]|uniref:Uncharacterized protein LOC104783417 n=1 Tax=Camelina sativa TaxID=90675 RepID=A0ABM0YWG8_CAMSA|nr:PREDICTED: uncharacterized protein LOC104783417 [Camelina sativa]
MFGGNDYTRFLTDQGLASPSASNRHGPSGSNNINPGFHNNRRVTSQPLHVTPPSNTPSPSHSHGGTAPNPDITASQPARSSSTVMFDQDSSVAATKLKGDEAKPRWIDPQVWVGLVRYWLDPKSEIKSNHSRNARYHDLDGTRIYKHRSGQTSFKVRARKHSEITGELTPDFLRILEDTHRKPDGSFTDGKSESVFNEVSSKIQELESELCTWDNGESSASGGVPIHIKNKIYTEVAPKKKNRIFGVGSLQFEASSSSSGPPPLSPMIWLYWLRNLLQLRSLSKPRHKECIATMHTSTTSPKKILSLLRSFGTRQPNKRPT